MKKLLLLTSMVCGLWLMVSSQVFAIDVIMGSGVVNDPYFQMNSSNLNTMNSYIIPSLNDIDPVDYHQIKYSLHKDQDSRWGYSFVKDTSEGYKAIHIMSSYIGFVVVAIVLLLIWFFGVKKSQTGLGQVLRIVFEGIRSIFDDILGPTADRWLKVYVVSLFFIILISNLLGVVSDMVRFITPQSLRRFTTPTAEFETVLALAIISTLIPLGLQLRRLGPIHFLHEYIPITGKGLIEGNGIGAKIGDTIVSLFVGFLDIVGIFSKVVSLSMRLFGNMSSGSILLNVAFLGLGGVFVGFIGMNFVVGIPLIVYIQGLLVAVVQAFVFSMLVSIGIKLSLE